MPFTLAHPVAAIGSGRLGLVPSAVAAGAMAPDAFYYLPAALSEAVPGVALTHSTRGWLGIDLVVGLLLFVAWRVALRRPALALLPQPLATVADDETRGPVVRRRPIGATARDLLSVVVSVLVGTATHLLLDLLTHESPAGGELAVLLDLRVGGLLVHDVLQVVFSLVGLGVLGWWAWSWQRRARSGADLHWPVSSALVLAATAVAAATGALVRIAPGAGDATATSLSGGVISALLGAVSAAAVVLLGYAAAWWLARAVTVRRATRPPGRGSVPGDRRSPGALTPGRRPRRPAGPATSPAAPPPSRTPG